MNITIFLPLQLHGNSENNGIVNSIDVFLSFLETLSGKSLADIFALVMPGITQMNNIHPLLVHFPIALLISFWMVDLIGSILKKPQRRYFASGLLYLGTLSTLVTVMTGFIAANSVAHDGEVHTLMERHKLLGLSVLTLAIILSGWRILAHEQLKEGANVCYLVLSAGLFSLILLGADIGGLMVYKYGVSVGATTENTTQVHSHNH
jgi:uncharacterized membrane protein